MGRTLHIFDVSPFLHAGHVNKASRIEKLINLGSTWRTQVTPTGGTSLIFNTLYEIMGSGDIVFCCDRNPVIKKDILPTYKSSRKHTRDMAVEEGIAEYILEQCGFTVLARAGYEADDLIYTIVKQNHDTYDNIYIYTGDSDMYLLVDAKVSIRPSSSRAKSVTLDTFKEVTKYDYNLITIAKIIFGDTPDEIPGLPKNVRADVQKFFYKPELQDKLVDYNFVKSWFDYLFPDYTSQVDLVFPLVVDGLPSDFKKPDKQAIANWGDAINNKCFRGRGSKDFRIEDYLEEITNLGLYVEED